ncbi:retrotransposon protein, putative, ty1-copia subclass [Tanacetum coccineum]
MTGTKFDIKKFDETGDFGLWRIKMRALLIQHGCEAALEVLPVVMEAQTKAKLNKKASPVSFKHEAFGKFKEWKQLVENQTGKTVKKLRTDKGLKFCNQEFEQLCDKSGIARHLTVARTSQQNGLRWNCKRLNNHTLEEDQTDQEDGDDEDAGDQETDQTLDLTDYQLIKEGIEGVQKPRYKERLVAHRFTQRACIDYNEICDLNLRQPSGYEQGNKVCLLKKSLYGLKQSPRQWYRRFDEYMLSNEDMLIACKSKAEIGSTKSLLKKEFDIKELEEANTDYILNLAESSKGSLGSIEVDFDIFVGHYKCGISVWDRSLQPCREAEYMALTEAIKEAIWLWGLLEELGVELNTVAVNYDNQGAIYLSRNHVFHERTKHINVCYHFIRDVLEAKMVK